MQKGIIIRIVICLICVAGLGFCLAKLVPELLDYREAEKTYETLEEQIVSIEGDVPDSTGVDTEPETAAVPEEENGEQPAEAVSDDWWYRSVSIDFDKLQKQNPEIVAWIRFDHQDQIAIDYPVALAEDDEKYLHTDINGKTSKAGTLFFEAEIGEPVSGDHLKDIMYGHMMKNGTMFAPLKKYVRDSSIYANNQYFTVYKKGMACRYRIFSCFITTAGSSVYQYGFTESDEQYRAHIDFLKNNSKVHDHEPDYGHKILTLSTCAKSNSKERIVITAELLETQETG